MNSPNTPSQIFSFTFIMRIKIKLLVADRREQTKNHFFPLPLNLPEICCFLSVFSTKSSSPWV